MKKRLGIFLILIFGISFCLASFSDLSSSHWAYDSVMHLTELGIISGMPDGTFRGNDPMTRYQSAVAMKRILDYSGRQQGTNTTLPSELEKRLTELESLVNRSLEAVQRAGEDYRKVMNMLENDSKDPTNSAFDYDDLERIVGEIIDMKLDSKNIEKNITQTEQEVQQLKMTHEQTLSKLDVMSFERNETTKRITELESQVSSYRWISISSAVLATVSMIMAGYVLLK